MGGSVEKIESRGTPMQPLHSSLLGEASARSGSTSGYPDTRAGSRSGRRPRLAPAGLGAGSFQPSRTRSPPSSPVDRGGHSRRVSDRFQPPRGTRPARNTHGHLLISPADRKLIGKWHPSKCTKQETSIVFGFAFFSHWRVN